MRKKRSLKKLWKRVLTLRYAVEIAELEQRLVELQKPPQPMGFVKREIQPLIGEYQGFYLTEPCIEEGVPTMGGKPSKGTSADKRLKENKPKAAPKSLPIKKSK